jgi:hypothetical protein
MMLYLDYIYFSMMWNQAVEARFNFFFSPVKMTDYASTEQRIRKGRPSDSVFAFNWPKYLIMFHSMVSHKNLHPSPSSSVPPLPDHRPTNHWVLHTIS